MSFEQALSELNQQQKVAATTTAKHCLVLAGAGCGKTKTIVARAAYLIAQGIPANQIQILTFTRRAASEIVARVEQYLGAEAKGLRASTFHTFCVYLLRRNPKAFGLESFSIIDRDDQLMIFRLLRGKGKDNHLPQAAQLCDLYSFARNTKMKLSDALEKVLPDEEENQEEIAQLLKAYEQRKQERCYLDYDDLLALVAVHLEASPALANWVGELCSHVLVDEMQDTNPLQWSLLHPLLEKSHLFCVGDDAQSIYGFRGADFENIHHFKDRIPHASVLTLEQNYRSTQEILDISNWLLQDSPINYNKMLQAVRGKGFKPQLNVFSNEFEEANWIVQDIQTRHHQYNASWRDHLVLVRSAFSARNIESACIRLSIPYRFIGGTKLLESAHVKDLLSFLRISAHFQDEIAWMRFLTLWSGVGDVGASKLTHRLVQCTDITQCCEILEQHGKVNLETILILKQLAVLQAEPCICIHLAIKALEEPLEYKYRNQDWKRREKDFVLVEQLAQKHPTIAEFLEAYVLDPISISEVERAEDNDVVTLSTIHSAKGTEQKVCYVPNITVNQYPIARAQGNFDAVEEERRILYVALTRAQNELILTKQDLNYALPDLVDEQGNRVSRYFFNALPQNLVHLKMIKADNTWQKKTKTRPLKRISFGLDFD